MKYKDLAAGTLFRTKSGVTMIKTTEQNTAVAYETGELKYISNDETVFRIVKKQGEKEKIHYDQKEALEDIREIFGE